MIHARRQLHGVDAQLDIHVAFDFSTTLAVGVFLGRLGDHGVAVVMQPVDQRPDRRILVILEQGGVVERAQQFTATHELRAQQLVVDIEPKRLAGGVEV